MRWLLLLVSFIATADSMPAKTRRAFEGILNEMFSLQLCNEDADCIDTYYSSPMCPATCSGCALAVNRRNIRKFEALKSRAQAIGGFECKPDECASVMKSCDIRCVENVCQGRMYIDDVR